MNNRRPPAKLPQPIAKRIAPVRKPGTPSIPGTPIPRDIPGTPRSPLPPPGARRTQHRLLLPLIGIMMLVTGGGLIWWFTQSASALPSHFAQVAEGFSLLPNDADLIVVGSTELLFAAVDHLRSLSPDGAGLLDNTVSTILGGIRELTFLTAINYWVGDRAALAISNADDGTLTYTLALDVSRESADSDTFLHNQLLGLDPTPETIGKYLDHQITLPTGTTHVFYTPGSLIVSNRAGLPNGALDNTLLRTALESLPASPYQAVVLLRDDIVLPFTPISATALNVVVPDDRYLAIGISQPAPDTTVIDLARTRQGASILSGVSGTALYQHIPATSLAVVQIHNPRAWHDSVLALPWINEMMPNSRSVVDQISSVLSLATGIDYQRDFLSWMTGDTLFFIDPPRVGEADQNLNWGVIAESRAPTDTLMALERVGGLALRADALRAIVPDLPVQVRVDEFDRFGLRTVHIMFGADGAIGAFTTTALNSGARLLVGSPFGVVHAQETTHAGIAALPFLTRFAAYTRADAAISAVIQAEAIERALAQWSTTPLSIDRTALPFSILYLTASLDDLGMYGARIVLIAAS